MILFSLVLYFILLHYYRSKFVEMGEASHRAIASLRFLVQSRPVDEATYGTIMTAPANVRASEVGR